MTLNRIQKLLFTEYNDFEDHVLLEGPFAQTSRDGQGIQQVYIGLTPTKLILARDYLEWREDPADKEDPVVGTLELLSVLPVEFVNLSVYRRKTRNTIKARFCNHKVVYFELASSFRREMFWNLWCERMRFLCPEEEKVSGSSASTDSINTSSSSTSNSYHGRAFQERKSWDERNLYLGTDFESASKLTIENSQEEMRRSSTELAEGKTLTVNANSQAESRTEDYQRIYRFGSGIDENCVTSLYLPAAPALLDSAQSNNVKLSTTSDEGTACSSYQMMCLAEDAVRIWEGNKKTCKKSRRSSGILPSGNYLPGFEDNEVFQGMGVSCQMKRSVSETNLRSASEDVQAGIPKRLLISTVSCESLVDPETHYNEEFPIRRTWRYSRTHGQELFWRPNTYSMSTRSSYKLLRRHLLSLTDFRKQYGAKKKKSIWTRFKKQHMKREYLSIHQPPRPQRSFNTLKKQLKMDITVSSWDFDSTILSYQLTLLDRDLFLMIPPEELTVLVSEKSSANTPNIKLLVDFSKRVANLIVTEIVRLDSVKMRARLIGKFINVADKLHRLHNMHSAHSVITGLTTPAIYRLRETWAVIKRHHYSKYKRLKTLLKLYRDVRTPLYCKMFEKFSRTPPYLPSIKCILYGLLGQLPRAHGLSGLKSYHSLTSFLSGKRQGLNVWRTQSAGGSLMSETTKNSLSSDSGECIGPYYVSPPSNTYSSRMLRLQAAKASLKIWQQAATMYDLIGSPLVREFLLKAKYVEEDESFFFSLRIEPNLDMDKLSSEMLQKMKILDGL